MQGTIIHPSATAKLLGVVFDRELRWKEHFQRAIKRATKVNLATGGLRQLRRAQMRQQYQACVTPVLDYASTVGHNPLKDKTHTLPTACGLSSEQRPSPPASARFPACIPSMAR